MMCRRARRHQLSSVGVVMLLALFGLAAVPALAQAACSTTRYVSAAGSDNAAGTSTTTAWKTLSKVSAASLPAGACVYLRGGDTFSGSLTFGADDTGTTASPIVVMQYGSGLPTISSGSASAVTIFNTGGITLYNLKLRGSGWSSNSASGVNAYSNSSGITRYPALNVYSTDISGYGGSGISFGSWGAAGFAQTNVFSVQSHDNGDAGIQYYGPSAGVYGHANATLTEVKTYNNFGIATKGSNSGSGIVLGSVDGGVVERSVSYNNGANNGFADGGPVGIWTYDSNAITIRHNESYSNKSGTAADGDGFDLDGGVTNSTMEYNYSHDNYGAGYLVYQYEGAPAQSGNTVRYNVSQNDARRSHYGAITVGAFGAAETGSVDVYGNTLYVTPSSSGGQPAGVRAWDGTRSARFFNNLVVTTGGVPLVSVESDAQATFLADNWYASGSVAKFLVGGSNYSDASATTYTSLSAWAAATGAERIGNSLIGQNVDPKLTSPGSGGTIGDAYNLETSLNAYKLLSTSTLRDNAGVDPFGYYGVPSGSTDFYGNAVPAGTSFSIGAHDS